MAIAIGTAIRSATSDVASVPQIRLSAPNWSVTTFHSVAGQESERRTR